MQNINSWLILTHFEEKPFFSLDIIFIIPKNKMMTMEIRFFNIRKSKKKKHDGVHFENEKITVKIKLNKAKKKYIKREKKFYKFTLTKKILKLIP